MNLAFQSSSEKNSSALTPSRVIPTSRVILSVAKDLARWAEMPRWQGENVTPRVPSPYYFPQSFA